MENIELKDNLCLNIFACSTDNAEDCVYGQKILEIPCKTVKCETYIEGGEPPFEDYCHACDKMYQLSKCVYKNEYGNCMNTIARVNKAVLFLKSVGINIENLQNICTK